MADEYKIPNVKVEQDLDNDPAPSYTFVDPEPAPAPEPEPFSVKKTTGKVGEWLKSTFPGNENAVVFGCIGLIAAILIFVVGIWRALLVTLFVLIGVAIGQVVDGDPKIIRTVQRFLSDRRD